MRLVYLILGGMGLVLDRLDCQNRSEYKREPSATKNIIIY